MMYYKKEGAGPALFFLHGFPNNHTIWADIWPFFTDKYEVYLPDFPGVGKSKNLKEELSLDLISFEIEKIMKHEQIDQAIFVGHSMGGYVAFNFASHFPNKVKALSLIHATAANDSETKRNSRLKAISLMQKGEIGKHAFLKAMSNNLFSEVFSKYHKDQIKKILESWKNIDTYTLTSLYKSIAFRPCQKRILEQSTFPIQWIIGNEDNATTMQDILQEVHIPKISDIQIYKPCGHMAMLECPGKLIKDLRLFLEFANRY